MQNTSASKELYVAANSDGRTGVIEVIHDPLGSGRLTVTDTWSRCNNCDKFIELSGPLCRDIRINMGLHFRKLDNNTDFLATVCDKKSEDSVTLRVITDYRKERVSGINALNIEQCFLMDAIMNPDIDLVIARGVAGTGKTLTTLAGGLNLLGKGKFRKIIFVRAFVPIGPEIGHLPGSKQDKIAPWMRAVYDNMHLLTTTDTALPNANRRRNRSGRKSVDILEGKISLEDMGVMQGSSLHDVFLIIDEAQNLTKKQMGIMLTRVGKGSKAILLGNQYCVDTKVNYGLTGLSHVWDAATRWKHAMCIDLRECVRSRLARWVGEHFDS